MTNANEVFSPKEMQDIMDVKIKIMDVHHKHRIGFEDAFEKYADSYVYAGGVFTSLLNNEEPKDIDFFILEDPISVEPRPSIWFETLLINRGAFQPSTIKHHDIKYMKNKHIKKVVTDTRSNIQYIFTDYKTREELIESFDYLHCCVSYYKGDLYLSKATYNTIRDKSLIVHNQDNWAKWREDKFLKRGWTSVTRPMNVAA
jgi:hypothetical protein